VLALQRLQKARRGEHVAERIRIYKELAMGIEKST
jgi:hypothetical protein